MADSRKCNATKPKVKFNWDIRSSSSQSLPLSYQQISSTSQMPPRMCYSPQVGVDSPSALCSLQSSGGTWTRTARRNGSATDQQIFTGAMQTISLRSPLRGTSYADRQILGASHKLIEMLKPEESLTGTQSDQSVCQKRDTLQSHIVKRSEGGADKRVSIPTELINPPQTELEARSSQLSSSNGSTSVTKHSNGGAEERILTASQISMDVLKPSRASPETHSSIMTLPTPKTSLITNIEDAINQGLNVGDNPSVVAVGSSDTHKTNGEKHKKKPKEVPSELASIREDGENGINRLKSFEEIEEENEEDDDSDACSIQLCTASRERQYPFKFKKCGNGHLLTIHHTVQEKNMLLRIRIAACSFNASCTCFVAMDRRGNVFVFDVSSKRYWQLLEIVLKPCIIVPWVQHDNLYLVGTKLGQLLRLDLDKNRITKSVELASEPIRSITFPGQPLEPQHMVLVLAGSEAILINLDKFNATHRLSFEEIHVSLKFAFFLPRSEHILTCFSNDSMYVWSCVTLSALRVLQPIRVRDRKLHKAGDNAVTATLSLSVDCPQQTKEFNVDCQVDEYTDGQILGYCCHPDGSLLCLSTIDKYLLFFNIYTYDLQYMCRLYDFAVRECVFLPQSSQPQSKELMLIALTTQGQVILLNCLENEAKLQLHSKHAHHLSISGDGKLLSVLNLTGELEIWSPCRMYNSMKSQQSCMNILKSAFKQNKPLSVGGNANVAASEKECDNLDLRKLLKRDRLLGMLREFRWFPRKYRLLIWCALLQLPYNRGEFQQLLRLSIPPAVLQRVRHLKIRNETLKRSLVRVWSCLAHWCNVFAYSEIVPALIFPFVKLFPRNPFVAFELCATLMLNHFQLWFELHPLEPSNYLGLCQNLLQVFAPRLCEFYGRMNIGPEHYAWPILSSAFSEVLMEEQWLCLWDNILAWPPFFLIFVVVAYNMLQREVIVRLPNRKTVMGFFHEQNAVDICKVISKAYFMMNNCPPTLHPMRYMKDFEPLPKNVYPKFVNYPREWLKIQEDEVSKMQEEQRAIDARIRQLELEEMKMMERLENGLREEEQKKQMKKMEQLYRDTIKRAEDRWACQQKMLFVYQKELRNRKAEALVKLHESERRQKAMQMEKELEKLTNHIEHERKRTDALMLIAEDQVHNQNFELYAQKCLRDWKSTSLQNKYADDLNRFCKQSSMLSAQLKGMLGTPYHADSSRDVKLSASLQSLEEKFNEIQNEFCKLVKNKK